MDYIVIFRKIGNKNWRKIWTGNGDCSAKLRKVLSEIGLYEVKK